VALPDKVVMGQYVAMRGQGRIRQQSTIVSGMEPDFSAKYDKALDLPFCDVVMYDYFFGGQRSTP
jgi:hypothetical protein